MSINTWEAVHTWGGRTWTKTAFTVAYANLDPDSPFYGDADYSAIAIDDECWYDPTTLPDGATVTMSGAGVFTLTGSWDETQTFEFAIYDGALGEIGTLTAEYVNILNATNVESASELSAPAIGQVHSLTASNVESASEVTAPVLTPVHVLTAVNVESASELTAPVLESISSTTDRLTPVSVESASELTAPALGQVHVLLAQNVESASEVSIPVINRQDEEEQNSGGYEYTYTQPPSRKERDKQRRELGILPKKPKKYIIAKDIPKSFESVTDIEGAKQAQHQLEELKSYLESVNRRGEEKYQREEQDRETLNRILLSLAVLEDRRKRIEEQDVAFCIMMLTA